MPNWCSNTFEITGPKEKIKSLWESVQKDEDAGGGLLQALHPMPKFETEGNDTMPNWWNWRVSNWGTKWEVSTEDMEYSEDGDTATIGGWFDSAWSPPTGAFGHYGYLNEDVKLRCSYYEPGMCFVGVYTVEGGVDYDEYHEYSNYDSKTVRDVIGAELDDEWNISESMAEDENFEIDLDGEVSATNEQEEENADE